MNRLFRQIVATAALLFLSVCNAGCAPGMLYTDVTEPLTTNMHNTPRGTKLAEISSDLLREPVTQLRLSAEWRSRAIGDAAKQAGLENIYHADLRTISILGNVWKHQTVRVWGE